MRRPRRFTFEHLNFATDSARAAFADAQQTVGGPGADPDRLPQGQGRTRRLRRLDGRRPAQRRSSAAQRAEAVQKALAAQGVAADRMKTATGGSSNPVDTNASANGRAENRRTELVVTAK